VLHDVLMYALVDAPVEGRSLFRVALPQRCTCSHSFDLFSMESKAPEILNSGLYWEQSNGLRNLLYFIRLFCFKVSKPSKKLLLRFTRQGNSRTKGDHSPSSLNWSRHIKENESATALREQGVGAKSIKSGENPEYSFPILPQSTTDTRNRHVRLQVPLGHKSFILGKQPSVQAYDSQPTRTPAARERRSACIFVCIAETENELKKRES